MTTPLSMRVPTTTAGDAATGVPETAAPSDAFASLLATLTGAVAVPVTVTAPPAPPALPAAQQEAAAPAVAVGPRSVPAVSTNLPATLLPLPPAAPAQPRAEIPGTDSTPSTPTTSLAPQAISAPTRPAAPLPSPPSQAVAPPSAPAPAAPAELHVETPVADAPVVPAVRREEPPAEEQLELVVPNQPAPPVAAAPVHAGAPEKARAVEPTHTVKPALLEAARGLRHEGGGRTSLVVRLDPPELGAVLVRLTVQDGRVDVQLRTPDLAARTDLQAQSYDVQQVLRDAGLDLRSFDVAQGDVLAGDLLQNGQERADTPDRGTRRQPGASDESAGLPPVQDEGADPQPAGTWL